MTRGATPCLTRISITPYSTTLSSGQLVNQSENGGGELTLPQRIGYQFDADVMVCVDTKLAMQHHNLRACQIAN